MLRIMTSHCKQRNREYLSREYSNSRDDISDLSADDTLRDSAAEGKFAQTEVGSNALNNRQSPVWERPQSNSTDNQHDNRSLTRNIAMLKSSTRRFKKR